MKAIALALSLLLAVPVVCSCGGALAPALRTVASIVDNALYWIDLIDGRYQGARDNLPLEVRAKMEKALFRARIAARDAKHTKDTGAEIVKQLRAAYAELVGAAAPLGVSVQGDPDLLGASTRGLAVPPAEAL